MPRRPRGELKKALVQIATELLEQTGSVEGVSIEEVVRRADCSAPALYYYFDTKDDLMLAVVLARLESAQTLWSRSAGVASRSAHGDIRDGILTAAHAFIDWARTDAAFFRVLFGTPSFAEDASRQGEAIISAPLNAAIAAGRITANEQATATLWGVLLGFGWLAALTQRDLTSIHAGLDRAVRGTIASLDGARRRAEDESRRLPRLFGARGR